MTGHGNIVLRRHGSCYVFEELSYSYPLKLLSPRLDNDSKAALSYILGYGGGLVGGDKIELTVHVESAASLLLLTQSSTKVFKPHTTEAPTTSNTTACRIASEASLFLLPDPVTCFEGANYEQLQSFHLEGAANLVVLDWFTSGRHSRGETWQFHHYGSVNEIFIDGRRVSLDILSLEKDDSGPSFNYRLSPYFCYASLFLCGPRVQQLSENLVSLSKITLQMQREAPASLVWSVSLLDEGVTVVRVAATETEAVKKWFYEHLSDLHRILGESLYELALG